MKSAIIVNPASGGGRTASMWNGIRDEVRTRLGGLVEYTTFKAGDATRFAHECTHNDTELVIIAGGDGSINEVINGLFSETNEPLNPNLKLAVLSTGRGCDFIKTINIPDDAREAVDLIVNPHYKKVDAGLALFKDEFGREQKRYFINIASAGLSGLVARRANKAPKIIPPGLVYFGAVAASFLTAKGQKMKISVDDKIVFDGLCMNAFVCNGSYSGSGMCWAPDAKLDDGLFDIVIGEPLPKAQIVLSGHRMYDGSFLGLPGVHHFKGKSVFIESSDDVLLELDGEQPGLVPVAFANIKHALNFIAPL